MDRGITAEISLEALSQNLSAIRKLAGSRAVIAVVKADAYGHGAVEVSRRLEREGVEYLATAFTSEARELREAGINSPIIVFFDPDPGDIFRYDLIPVISDNKTASHLSSEALRRGRELAVHIKVDTGMGRMGLKDNAVEDIIGIARLPGLLIDGVMSHFSEADLADQSFAMRQIASLRDLRQALKQKGIRPRLYHIANSAAVMNLQEACFDAVRPGIMLYGYSSLPGGAEVVSPDDNQVSFLRPVMSLKARLIRLRRLCSGTPVSYGRTFVTKRDSLIGVMAAGYADGFSRCFSNNADVLVRGRRVPVVGRVCMDLTMLDLTDVEDAAEGDDVVIMGRQGSESIDACECALRADTIPYEILTLLGRPAHKVYI